MMAPRRPHHGPPALLALTALGISIVAAALVLTTSGTVERVVARAALHAGVIVAPVATGLFAMRHPGSARFGRMLIVTGLIWSLAVFSESTNSVVYSTGRVIAWLTPLLLVYVMVAFPEGRIALRRDRILFGSGLATVVVLYIASALVSDSFPKQSPWASCSSDCPPNAFMLLGSEPAFVDSLVQPVRDGLATLVLLGVTVSLSARVRAANPIRRVTTTPVLVVGIVATFLLGAFIVVRRLAPGTQAPEILGTAWALCLPSMAVAFYVGLLQRRLFIGQVLGGLSLALTGSTGPRGVGAALRSSIGDPGVEVLVPDAEGTGWAREDGREADLPAHGLDGRIVHRVGPEDAPLAAVVLDAAVDADDELMDAILALTEASLREAHLMAELERSLRHLDESRRRIATAAEVERRRIERDLHDGAQQRLIAMRMRLSLAEDLLRDDPASAAPAIRALGGDVDDALEEIRSLAHGIYPPLLADRGLADAVTAAGRGCPLPVEVRASAVTRHPPEIEGAVYFSCLEALQNVAKHARGATRARISLRQDHMLRFEVADDGGGFDGDEPAGAGMRNMRDRIEALGGRLAVTSDRRGTLVRGSVPLPAPSPSGTRGDARPLAHDPIGERQRRGWSSARPSRPAVRDDGVELGAEQQGGGGEPDPEQQDDRPGEGAVGGVVGGEAPDVDLEADRPDQQHEDRDERPGSGHAEPRPAAGR
jgi:signal transduction histidine kinase